MVALCWHNMPAYEVLNYAGICDRGLIATYRSYIQKEKALIVDLILMLKPWTLLLSSDF